MESRNSCTVVEAGLDEIPSTSNVDYEMPHSPIAKVNPFHVIFDLDRVLVATHLIKVLALSFCVLDWRNS